MTRPARILAPIVVALGLGSTPVQAADPSSCNPVRAAVAELYARHLPIEPRIELAHLAPVASLDPLLRHAELAIGAESQASYLAIGLSRHADALKKLRALPDPGPGRRLGLALALLALGDPSGTGTVAWSLTQAPREIRRRTAEALGVMHQVRPRIMLYDALEDPDPVVRLISAEILVRARSRQARKELLALTTQGPVDLRGRAAVALFERGISLDRAELAALPGDLRGQAFVREYLGARNPRVQTLRPKFADRSPIVRAGALAAVAAAGGVSRLALERYTKVAVAARGPDAETERTAALALMGDAEALTRLTRLDAASIPAAVRVIWAFAGAPAPYHRLDEDHAARLARAVDVWWRQGNLGPEQEAQLLRALHRADPPAGLGLARRRLTGGPGPALEAAADILSEIGEAGDVGPLLAAAGALPPAAQVPLLTAAFRLCRRQPGS